MSDPQGDGVDSYREFLKHSQERSWRHDIYARVEALERRLSATPPLAPCEPSAEFVKAADEVRACLGDGSKILAVGKKNIEWWNRRFEAGKAYDRARALFVKEKLT